MCCGHKSLCFVYRHPPLIRETRSAPSYCATSRRRHTRDSSAPGYRQRAQRTRGKLFSTPSSQNLPTNIFCRTRRRQTLETAHKGHCLKPIGVFVASAHGLDVATVFYVAFVLQFYPRNHIVALVCLLRQKGNQTLVKLSYKRHGRVGFALSIWF